MEFASQIVGDVVKTLLGYITKHIGYITSSTKHVKNMRNRMKHLEGTYIDVKKNMDSNTISELEVPARIPGWLKDVETFKKDVANISGDGIGCFNLKRRHQATINALEATEKIEGFIKESHEIIWSNKRIPLGKSHSKSVSTSSPSTSASGLDTQIGFKSRDKVFNDALNLLQQQDSKARVIALCGMGGVGKSTMMEQLKKFVEDKNMFNWIVKVVIGRDFNTFSIQNAIAECTGEHLIETTETVKVKKKILVILDDVWEKVELKSIGLTSPLPNGVKLLLTSRDENICTQIAVDADSVLEIVRVDVLEEMEAQNFFCRITGISEEHDSDLYQIGRNIVKKCGCLPLAIKLIAATLKSKQSSAWRYTLKRLNKNDLDKNVEEIIEISYMYLEGQEDRAILLLCGLFPEDFNIPIEDLTRYAWGLKLLKQVSTLGDARDKTEICVSNLKNANLLMDGDIGYKGCVKMHDLVLAFVLASVSKSEDAWIIDHGGMLNWSEVNTSQSCKRISLSCNGRSAFPSDFTFPNLSVLKLMHGNTLFKFPYDFYDKMEKLQVIAYERMRYPLLPPSFQHYTNLQTLCLHNCSLMTSYLVCIGNLLDLEVLSFANSKIEKLPSTIGNLKKLRLLDLTGCCNLVIDDGVLKNLVKLEEFYMRADYKKSIFFTKNNYSELAERSQNLSALEVELFKKDDYLKNMSYEKLERFKISVGCFLEEWIDGMLSYGNTLMIDIKRSELLESRMNELFVKTEVLFLQVNNMKDLEDVTMKLPPHPPRRSSFYNLKVLVVSKCVDLRYLFAIGVATALTKLEYLFIKSCPIMEELIHIDENNGAHTLTIPKLKIIRLTNLPKLSSFCNNVNLIELPQLLELNLDGLPNVKSIYPKNKVATSSLSSDYSTIQSFFKEEVAISKLERLNICNMENLVEIWSCEFNSDNVCVLREINVRRCGNLVNLFPSKVSSSKLRSIQVQVCDSLVNLFPRNPISLLNHLEELEVTSCGSIEDLFNIDMGCIGEMGQVSISMLRRIHVWGCNSLVNLFPSNPMPLLNHLEELIVGYCGSIEVLFNIDMGCIGEMRQVSRSMLRRIYVSNLRNLREAWRIKGGDAKNNYTICGFQIVERIDIQDCKMFRNIFTPATIKFDMGEIVDIFIKDCGERQRNNKLVKSNHQHISVRSEEAEGKNDDISDINIAFPTYVITHSFHHLRKLYLKNYRGVGVVFEIESLSSSSELSHDQNTRQPLLTYLEEIELSHMEMMSHVWKCWNWNEFLTLQKQYPQSSLHNLTTLKLRECNHIKYVFSPLMAKLFSNLKNVKIAVCRYIEEVVSNRDDSEEAIISSHTNIAFFPHLDILDLSDLNNLKRIGGCVNSKTAVINDQLKLISEVSVVSWSLCQYPREIRISWCDSLSNVVPIYALRQMQKLQNLKIIKCNVITEVFETQRIKNDSSGDSVGTNTILAIPRPDNTNVPQLSNLKIMDISYCISLQYVFTFSTLKILRQLEVLKLEGCYSMKVIVSEENGEETSSASEVVIFPHLKSLTLFDLTGLEGFFLGVNGFQWPLLDEVHIRNCPQMRVFTSGQSTAPELKYIHTILGKHSVSKFGLNFHETTTLHQTRFPSSESTHGRLEQFPWFFRNLIEMYVDDSFVSTTIIPTKGLHQLQMLKKIHLRSCLSVREVFEVVSLEGKNTDSVVEIPNLRRVELENLSYLRWIWKSNKIRVLKFPSLTTLTIYYCRNLTHVLGSSMVCSVLTLQDLHIRDCPDMHEIIKEEECDTKVEKIELPCLNSLKLHSLKRLRRFCIYGRSLELPSLTTLSIYKCRWFQHVFGCSMVLVGNLLNLKELHIDNCEDMEVVVKEEEKDVKVVSFPFLKSLTLYDLPRLKGFCLEKELAVLMQSLDTLEIKKCPRIKVFTRGHLNTPELKLIHTEFGKGYVREDINSFINNKQQEGFQF